MKCRECGCTDELSCPGGCYWYGPGLCSRCVSLSGMKSLVERWRKSAARLRKAADCRNEDSKRAFQSQALNLEVCAEALEAIYNEARDASVRERTGRWHAPKGQG